MYIGKNQCRLCGLRFTAKQKASYKHHLDWHYLENKHEKDVHPTRSWYSSVQEWTIYEENIEDQIRIETIPSNPLIIPDGENIRSSSGMISCPAISNGDIDDDVCYDTC